MAREKNARTFGKRAYNPLFLNKDGGDIRPAVERELKTISDSMVKVAAAGRSFNSIQQLITSGAQPGDTVTTRGYHRPDGHGSAAYDIWDLDAYRAAIDNANWLPDGEEWVDKNGKTHYAGGDHLVGNNVVAILRWDNVLWAGQCGLEDPVDNEDDYIAKGANHTWTLQKALDYAKLQLSFNKSDKGRKLDDGSFAPQNGFQQRRNLIMHIERGVYVIEKTIWVPANIWLCGGDTWGAPPCVDIIPLKPHLGGKLSYHNDSPLDPVEPDGNPYSPNPHKPLPDDYTYVRDYMFIFNGQRHLDTALGANDNLPWGSTPGESIYISPYVGGISSIDLNNYETDYEKLPNGKPDWYKPNYLKGIKGIMCFGSFWGLTFHGERLNTIYQRPGIDWDDFYCDAVVIDSMKTNAPIHEEYFTGVNPDLGINNDYLLDFNGSGDVVRIEGCQFPVHHPPKASEIAADPDIMWPDGEYKFGMSRSVRLQNSQLYAATSVNASGVYSGGGMQIKRCINGKYLIRGYRNVHFDSCHIEYGQIICDEMGAVQIDNCYFSKVTQDHYNMIECRKGQYGGSNAFLQLNQCMFHYGFDGTHLPPMQDQGYYDVVCNNNWVIEFNNCAQEWDTATNPTLIGLQVGKFNQAEDAITPLKGWDRWSMYLSESGRINCAKIVPQKKYFWWNGFEGVQDLRLAKTKNPRLWTLPPGDYYYYAQVLFDKGDETSPPDFVPLGKDQRDRNVLDAAGNDTGVRYDAHVLVKPPGEEIDPGTGNKYTAIYRPVISFYNESDTPNYGYLRLYRGTQPFQYSHYVDLPTITRSYVDDYGDRAFGRAWIPNPLPVDNNPDLSKRKRNVFETTGEMLTEYSTHITGGDPITDSVPGAPDYYGRTSKIYYGTGYWKSAQDKTVKIAGNKHTRAPEVGFSETICIFNRPFIHNDPQHPNNYEVYCSLPSSGLLNWDGKPLKFNKGDIVHIVRTKETALKVNPSTLEPILDAQGNKQYWPKTVPNYEQHMPDARPLMVQTSVLDPAGGYNTNPDGSVAIDPDNKLPVPKTINKIIRNMGPDEILTCIYDEIDVRQPNGTYWKQGEWVVVNGGSLSEEIPPISVTNITSWSDYPRINMEKSPNTVINIDYAADANADIGLQIADSDSTDGSRITIHRSNAFKGVIIVQVKTKVDTYLAGLVYEDRPGAGPGTTITYMKVNGTWVRSSITSDGTGGISSLGTHPGGAVVVDVNQHKIYRASSAATGVTINGLSQGTAAEVFLSLPGGARTIAWNPQPVWSNGVSQLGRNSSLVHLIYDGYTLFGNIWQQN